MKIAFDPTKDAINRDKHGVSLAFGERVFDDVAAITFTTVRPKDGEDRSKIVGLVDGRSWTAIHVARGGVVRFISVGRSNDAEARGYHRHPRRSG